MNSFFEGRPGKGEQKNKVSEAMERAIEQKDADTLIDALEKSVLRFGAGHGELYSAVAETIVRKYPEGAKGADRATRNLLEMAKDLRGNASMLRSVAFPPGRASAVEYMTSLRRFFGTEA